MCAGKCHFPFAHTISQQTMFLGKWLLSGLHYISWEMFSQIIPEKTMFVSKQFSGGVSCFTPGRQVFSLPRVFPTFYFSTILRREWMSPQIWSQCKTVLVLNLQQFALSPCFLYLQKIHMAMHVIQKPLFVTPQRRYKLGNLNNCYMEMDIVHRKSQNYLNWKWDKGCARWVVAVNFTESCYQ